MSDSAAGIVAIGEILWDVFDGEEHLGGAPFNFAAHTARLGHKTMLLSAVAKDDRGARALEKAEELGVSTRLIRRVEKPPTGHVTVTVDAGGQPEYVIHRPAAYDAVALSDEDLAWLSTKALGWVYFGTLLQTSQAARAVTRQLFRVAPQARRIYDVNLRRDSYNRELLAELLPLATVLKINASEAEEVRRLFKEPASDVPAFAREYAERFDYEGVCVTLGAQGCYVLWKGREILSESYPVTVRDAVGAGDAFAAAFVHGVTSDWPIEKTTDFANRVGSLVASHAGAVPKWSVDQAWRLVR